MNEDHNNPDVSLGITLRNTIKVLLVDDQEIIAHGIRKMLASENDIELVYCQDASQAIATAEAEQVTVVLLDLVMPDIDGMTLMRFFRANHTTKDIPIIVMSSKEDSTVKRDAFSSGANDYLVKLPDEIELIARLRAHSKQYIMQVERDAAFTALRQMQFQLQQTNDELQRLSSLDSLTGISNRRIFDEKLASEWTRAAREQIPLTIMLVDVDYFKLYNDYYGHQNGDVALRQVAQGLKTVVNRPADIVARYGGEEFGIILPNTDQAGGDAVAKSFCQSISRIGIEHSKSSVSDTLTISVGACTITPSAEHTLEMLLAEADKALYAAKANGRNTVVIKEITAMPETKAAGK
jgi:two-component system chemotaxis family response regulator WspR